MENKEYELKGMSLGTYYRNLIKFKLTQALLFLWKIIRWTLIGIVMLLAAQMIGYVIGYGIGSAIINALQSTVQQTPLIS